MSDQDLFANVDFSDWLEPDYSLSATGDDSQPIAISNTDHEYPDAAISNVPSSVISESQPPNLPLTSLAESRYMCGVCQVSFKYLSTWRYHIYLTGHAPYKCNQCGELFKNSFELSNHSRDTGHAVYKCSFAECDATFSRRDILVRHRIGHKENATKHSCPHCKKWRAPNGFARRDHLTQHLRNYHHFDLPGEKSREAYGIDPREADFFMFCPYQECSLFRQPKDWRESRQVREEHLFKSRSTYTAHLRKEHNDSPFPCTVSSCKRIGGKGYFRRRDLMKHMAKEHPVEENQAAEHEDFEIEAGNVEIDESFAE